MNIRHFINSHIAWSRDAFGKNYQHIRICNHIRKELTEIETSPKDLFEWIDVMFLALDGAWRAGYTAEEIMCAMQEKQKINMGRKWGVAADGITPNEHIEENK